MMGMMGGTGMLLGFLFWAGVLALLAWALFSVFPTGQGESCKSRKDERPLDILKKRYAGGEISQAEFEQARRSLI